MRAVVIATLWVIGTTGLAGHDDPATLKSDATFKSRIDLVALNVVVVNSRQQFVSGLTANDFAVYEDGVRQDLSYFSSGEVPLDLAILLDTSSSMHDKLATAQQAAIGFISMMRPSDRLLVIDIKDSSKVLAPLSPDRKAAQEAILETSASGATALYNGLYLTLREMAKQRRAETDVRRQAVVLLSDGDDTSSLVSFDDVMELAKQSGISIYTIMLSSAVDVQFDRRRDAYASKSAFGMKSLALETGARSFPALQIGDLAGAYKSIGHELTNQYAIGYTSTNQRRDGTYRRVVVRVVDRANAEPRTRAGYLAPRS